MLAQLLKRPEIALAGIDIGTHVIKCVVLSKKDENLRLDAFISDNVPPDVVVDREIQDIEQISKVLNRIRKKLPKKVKNASIAVSGSTVFSKIIQMDKGLTDIELEQQIEIEADSLIPYPLDEVFIDFEVIGENALNNKKDDVILSAARKQIVNGRVDALSEGGFTASVVDIEGFALGRAVHESLSEEDKDKTIACIDIGANQTLFSVLHQGEVVFSNDQVFGVNQLLQSACNVYGLTPKEAATKLKDDDWPENFENEVLLPYQMNLVQQIKRMLQMYITSSNYDSFDLVMLSGDGSNQSGFVEMVQESISSEVASANPFKDIQLAGDIEQELVNTSGPQFMVAFGLALRRFSSCHI